MESHHEDQLLRAFKTKDLYKILEISKDCTSGEIKSAYRKKALIFHPDKGGDPELFKALSIVYSILSDENKRKVYDETGDVDADDELFSQDFDHFYEYFRNLFPKVTVSDIEKFGDNYIGSDEQKADILEAYHKHQGSVAVIMEVVMFAEDEDDICRIIDNAIESEGIPVYPLYRKYKDSASKRKGKSKAKAKKAAKEVESPGLSLEEMILNKSNNRQEDLISSILGKYGNKTSSSSKGGKKKVEDISDEAFEATQKRMLKERDQNQNRKADITANSKKQTKSPRKRSLGDV